MLTSGFYNSIDHDRRYGVSDLSDLFNGIMTEGVFKSIGNEFSVTSAGYMSVNVNTGRAWLHSKWVNNDSIYPVQIAASDPSRSRIDAIVIEIDETNTKEGRLATIKSVQGTPNVNPGKPEMIHTKEKNQYPLAYVKIGPNASYIYNSDITTAIGAETKYVNSNFGSIGGYSANQILNDGTKQGRLILSKYQYGPTLPESALEGQVFFTPIE